MSFHNTKNTSKGRHPSSNKWRNEERHYCSACNVWMGSDRQSIRLHENGKKHKENVEFQLVQRRQTILREDKEAKKLQSALQQMEQAAAAKMNYSSGMILSSSSATGTVNTTARPTYAGVTACIHPNTITSSSLSPTPPQISFSSSNHTYPPAVVSSNNIKLNVKLIPTNPMADNSRMATANTGSSTKVELNAWHERKIKREKDRVKHTDEEEEDTNASVVEVSNTTSTITANTTKRHLAAWEGHYTIGTSNYLEGNFFAN